MTVGFRLTITCVQRLCTRALILRMSSFDLPSDMSPTKHHGFLPPVMDVEHLVEASVISKIEEMISPFADDLSQPSKRMTLPIRTRSVKHAALNASLELGSGTANPSVSRTIRGVSFPGSTPKEGWKFGNICSCEHSSTLLTGDSCHTPHFGSNPSGVDKKCHHDQEVLQHA